MMEAFAVALGEDDLILIPAKASSDDIAVLHRSFQAKISKEFLADF